MGRRPIQFATVQAQLIDDLVRQVMIIAASPNPLPPDPRTMLPRLGYTAHQHLACVEACRKLIAKHHLRDWQVTTAGE